MCFLTTQHLKAIPLIALTGSSILIDFDRDNADAYVWQLEKKRPHTAAGESNKVISADR